MKTTISLYLIFIFLLISGKSFSQEPGIRLLCSPRPDSILLRWAPVNPNTWRLANEYGYIVKRFTVLKNKKVPKEIKGEIISPRAFKPQPLEAWKPFAEDKYVSIAAECIFGSEYKDAPTGNNPFMAYKKYQEELHRYSFALYAADQSLKAAELSGLYFADKAALKDEKYLYKVYINAPDSIVVDTAFAFTGISEYQPLPRPLELKAEWGDNSVDLSWNYVYLGHIYNSYILEKSDDGGKSYRQVGENATVQLSDKGVVPDYMYKTDSLENNNTIYYYRVRGVSAFGETGPPSDSVFGNGMLPLGNPPVIVDNQVLENKYVQLNWEYPERMNKYISGFKIYRSSGPKGKKEIVYKGGDPYVRAFIDSAADFTNYYLISVYNTKEEKLSKLVTYAERVDSFPPVPPVKLIGNIDTTGAVTVSWKPNTDRDLKGYRVYWANNPRFEFMLATPGIIGDTIFTDSINLKTLTRNIYYKVKAVDVRDNQSAFSELLTLERPDIIPPVSPVIKNIEDKNGYPEISWVNSSSSDAKYHQVYRKAMNDTVWEQVGKLEITAGNKSSYTDKTPEKGEAYSYYVVSEDATGLVSGPSNFGYFKMESGIKESLKLKKKLYTDRVELSWTVQSDKKVSKILVFRGVGEGALRLYGNSEEEVFIDNKLSPEKTYNYAIQAIYEDGSSSVLSNIVKIKM